MKTKFFFSFIAAFLLQFSTVKADTYSDGIQKLIENGVLNYGPSTQADAELTKTMVDFLLPYYRENMSEKQFSQMVDYYLKPENVELQKKVLNSISSDPEKMQGMFTQEMMQKFVFGGTPDNLKLPECDPQLLKEIQHHLDISNTIDISASAFSVIKDLIPKQMAGNMPEGQREQIQKLFNSLFGYLENNIGVIVTTQMLQSLTLDDMKKLNTIEKESFFPSYQKTNIAVSKDLKPLLETILQKAMKR